jgi:hypothetical protein
LRIENKKTMYAEQTTLNPIQLHLLEMFNHCNSEKMMLELKEVLAEFYAKQVQEEADRLWDEGTLNGEAIERILDEHWRTPNTVIQ